MELDFLLDDLPSMEKKSLQEILEAYSEYEKLEGINQSKIKKAIFNKNIKEKDSHSPFFSAGNLAELLLMAPTHEVEQFYMNNDLVFAKDEIPTGQLAQAIHLAYNEDNLSAEYILAKYREISNSRKLDGTVLKEIDKYQKYIRKVEDGQIGMIIDNELFEDILNRVIAIKNHPLYIEYLKDASFQIPLQATVQNGDETVKVKGLLDAYNEEKGYLIDIKYTTFPNYFDFRRAILQFRYDLQLSFYKYLLQQNNKKVNKCYLFVVFSTKQNPLLIEMTEDDLEFGEHGIEIYEEASSSYAAVFRKTLFGWRDGLSILRGMELANHVTLDDFVYEMKGGILVSNLHGKTI